MNDAAWQMERTVEANVTPEFAWSYRTDVRTWADPPAQFTLAGPFAVGSQGRTKMPGQDPIRWSIGSVQPGESFTIEMPLEGATLTFEWRFEAIADRRTMLTQRVTLSGENAAAHLEEVRAVFSANLEPGMKRIVAEMEASERIANAAAKREP